MQFLLIAYDGTDEKVQERRLAVREKHIEYCKPFKERGQLIIGGAILDGNAKMIGSMLVYDFPNKEELDLCISKDPYVTGQVWKEIKIKPFKVGPIF